METERARCNKCGAPIASNQNVIFPKVGGVEHLDCTRTRKPLARIGAGLTGVRCIACDMPITPGERVAMIGHDVLHASCVERLRAINGASGAPVHRLARPIIDDPFARLELVLSGTCAS